MTKKKNRNKGQSQQNRPVESEGQESTPQPAGQVQEPRPGPVPRGAEGGRDLPVTTSAEKSTISSKIIPQTHDPIIQEKGRQPWHQQKQDQGEFKIEKQDSFREESFRQQGRPQQRFPQEKSSPRGEEGSVQQGRPQQPPSRQDQQMYQGQQGRQGQGFHPATQEQPRPRVEQGLRQQKELQQPPRNQDQQVYQSGPGSAQQGRPPQRFQANRQEQSGFRDEQSHRSQGSQQQPQARQGQQAYTREIDPGHQGRLQQPPSRQDQSLNQGGPASAQQGRPQQIFPSERQEQTGPQQKGWQKVAPGHAQQEQQIIRQQVPPGARYKDIDQERKQDLPSIEKLEPTPQTKDSSIVSEMQKMDITTPTEKQTSPVSQSSSSQELSQPSSSSKSPAKKQQYAKLDINIKMSPTIRQKFLPKRPDDGGKKGRVIQLIINCLNVKINPMKIFMYDIDLTKAEVIGADKKKRDITPKMKKKDSLRELLLDFLKDKDGLAVFDGGKIIFNNKLMPFPDGVNKITYNYKLEGENITCYFTIQRVKEEDIELDNLNYYVTSRLGQSSNMPQEELRALDAIMREMFLNKNLISLGRRAIFDPKTKTPLRCGPYILMEGYSTSIRPHMWNIRFNFDKTQVVCHQDINLLDYISKIMDINRGFNTNILTKKLKTLRVQANHLKNAEGKPYTRKYTIFGFSKKNAKEEKIPDLNITIEQYFLKEYNIKLKRPDLPMVKTSPAKNTFVPIELLTMLPFQKVMDNDGRIVQEVIRHAAIPCFDRLDKLRKAVQSLDLGNRVDRFMKNYMIEIDPKLINVNGRILDGPDAIFGEQRKELLRGGKWDLRSKKFLKPYDKLVNWALFAVGTERDYQRNEQPLFEVEDTLANAARKVGINMAKNYEFNYVTYQQIEIVARAVIEKSLKEKKKLDLLVFIVNSDDDYRSVKRFGDMSYGIPTQCMKYANLQKQKALDQYLGNIMLKINGKLGGTNWELSAIRNSQFTPIKDTFMVFGIDVTHPSATKNDLSKSVAAMVGSLDHNATLYSATIRQQKSKRENAIIEELMEMEDMVHGLLMNFYRVNKALKPKHLMFYRDGVSEGQFERVFNSEIVAIQDACQKLDKSYQPKITYIVVQKRHKIRFFPQNEKDGVGRSGNVPAGTIVDKDITHCREFDFYLCSHEGIQGTSKPAHYHVLFDENNWGSDDLQSFTYFLCHLYARCTRSVSYPAPTYYAHLAAFRGRTLIGLTDDDSSSVASGHSQRTDSSDTQILINEFHNDKLFFI